MKKTYRLHFALVLGLDIVSALTARYAFESGSLLFLLLSMASLCTAGYFFIKLMQQEVGILVNITWVALGTVNVTLASWIVFGEKVTAFQAVAMAVIVTGLALTEVFAPKEEPAVAPSNDDALLEPSLQSQEAFEKDEMNPPSPNCFSENLESSTRLKLGPIESISDKEKTHSSLL